MVGRRSAALSALQKRELKFGVSGVGVAVAAGVAGVAGAAVAGADGAAADVGAAVCAGRATGRRGSVDGRGAGTVTEASTSGASAVAVAVAVAITEGATAVGA